jgi:serine/threonine protein kinase
VIPDRWRALTEIFHEALLRDASSRTAFINEACGGDSALCAEVESLVAAHDAAGSFGESPAFMWPAAVQLAPGTALGPYRIEALIGTGGMGQVYKAKDTRLERTVALKILPPHLRQSPERQARLQKEARSVSRLTHPNICPLYDIGREGDIDFLVMAYLEGETLDVRLVTGALPLADLIRTGIEIAAALAHAHGHGVVHRDLKPSNVMLTESGAKLLDFGLAKAAPSASAAGLSTSTRSAETVPGTWVGTLAYMAPEQLHGREADARADLWALGCVLYEMATGRRAFDGASQAAVVAAVLEREPAPVRSVAASVPTALEHVIGRCLTKDREQRWQSAADVEQELRWIDATVSPHPKRDTHSSGRRPISRFALSLLVGTAVLTLTLVTGAWMMSQVQPSSTGSSYQVSTAVTWSSTEHTGRLSPDGNWLAFISDREGDPRPFLHNVKSGESKAVDVPNGGASGLGWSPDGQELAVLLRQGQTVTLQIAPAFFGGATRAVSPIDEPARIVSWIDDTVYIEHRFSLLGVDIRSGTVAEVLRPDPAAFPVARGFDVSSDGRVVFSAQVVGNEDLWLTDVRGTVPVRLTDHPGSDLSGVLAGGAVFFQSSRGGQASVWRLNLADRTLRQLPGGDSELWPDDATADGRLIAVAASAAAAEILARDSLTGETWAVTSDSKQDLWPSFSGDGSVIAYQRRRRSLDTAYLEGEAEIVVGRWDGRKVVGPRVAIGSGFAPRVSADGRWLAYLEWTQASSDVVALKAQELATGRSITVAERFVIGGYSIHPLDWLATNFTWSDDALLFADRDRSGVARLARFNPDKGGAAEEIVRLPDSQARLQDICLSGDGDRMAYTRYDIQTSVLRVRDLSTGKDEDWLTDRHGRQGRMRILGWDDGRLLAVRSRRNEGLTNSLEFLALDGPGRISLLQKHPAGYAATSRLDLDARRILVTLRENGADNLFALPLEGGAPQRLTSNDRGSVSFSNVVLLPDHKLVFSRHDRQEDLWLLHDTDRN